MDVDPYDASTYGSSTGVSSEAQRLMERAATLRRQAEALAIGNPAHGANRGRSERFESAGGRQMMQEEAVLSPVRVVYPTSSSQSPTNDPHGLFPTGSISQKASHRDYASPTGREDYSLPRGGQEAEEIFAAMDMNGDGVITREEFQAAYLKGILPTPDRTMEEHRSPTPGPHSREVERLLTSPSTQEYSPAVTENHPTPTVPTNQQDQFQERTSLTEESLRNIPLSGHSPPRDAAVSMLYLCLTLEGSIPDYEVKCHQVLSDLHAAISVNNSQVKLISVVPGSIRLTMSISVPHADEGPLRDACKAIIGQFLGGFKVLGIQTGIDLDSVKVPNPVSHDGLERGIQRGMESEGTSRLNSNAIALLRGGSVDDAFDAISDEDGRVKREASEALLAEVHTPPSMQSTSSLQSPHVFPPVHFKGPLASHEDSTQELLVASHEDSTQELRREGFVRHEDRKIEESRFGSPEQPEEPEEPEQGQQPEQGEQYESDEKLGLNNLPEPEDEESDGSDLGISPLSSPEEKSIENIEERVRLLENHATIQYKTLPTAATKKIGGSIRVPEGESGRVLNLKDGNPLSMELKSVEAALKAASAAADAAKEGGMSPRSVETIAGKAAAAVVLATGGGPSEAASASASAAMQAGATVSHAAQIAGEVAGAAVLSHMDLSPPPSPPVKQPKKRLPPPEVPPAQELIDGAHDFGGALVAAGMDLEARVAALEASMERSPEERSLSSDGEEDDYYSEDQDLGDEEREDEEDEEREPWSGFIDMANNNETPVTETHFDPPESWVKSVEARGEGKADRFIEPLPSPPESSSFGSKQYDVIPGPSFGPPRTASPTRNNKTKSSDRPVARARPKPQDNAPEIDQTWGPPEEENKAMQVKVRVSPGRGVARGHPRQKGPNEKGGRRPPRSNSGVSSVISAEAASPKPRMQKALVFAASEEPERDEIDVKERSPSPTREGVPQACQSAHVIGGEFTNAKVILRALTYTLLAADCRRSDRELTIKAIREHPNVAIFIILLTNERSHSFRGLYRLDENFLGAYKIHGGGPDCVSYSDVSGLFKYNMANKMFKQVNTSSFGVNIDAMVLHYKKRQWYKQSHDGQGDGEASYAASTYASEAKTSFG